jgi:hypothetical protein
MYVAETRCYPMLRRLDASCDQVIFCDGRFAYELVGIMLN